MMAKNRHVQITKIVVKNIPGNHRKLLMTTDEAEEGRFQIIQNLEKSQQTIIEKIAE